MKVHLIDGTYELFRSFYGPPPKKAPDGREVGATVGLMRSLLALLNEPEVTHVGVAFDHVVESFRNDLFAGYKTGEGIDPNLREQFDLAEEAVAALGIVVWPMVEFEADDAIATAAVRLAADPVVEQVVVCSPDKDLAQLVSGSRVVCWDRRREVVYDEEAVIEKYGVPPASIPDWLALAHTVNPDRTYHLLQQRLDRNVTGAPDSPVFTQILKLLFSTEEADIARQMPTQFTSLGRLARKLEVDPAALDDKLTRMAQRGLVLDVERHGKRYFTLAPVVIGFFEFTFMRTRDNLPMAELARLFEEYFFQDDHFARAVFSGETQIGRSLVREEGLPTGDHVEILDWERAVRLCLLRCSTRWTNFE